MRTHFGTRNYHRPPMYRPLPYHRYYHSPWSSIHVGVRRYHRSYDYYWYVRRSYPNYVYLNWIYWPTAGYNNGYYVFNDYPYYVWNGYRYRYSRQDQCNYQLVDTYTHQVVRSYWGLSCNNGYDQCSFERDRMNDASGDFRYNCSETFRDQNYDYSRPTYDYGYGDYDLPEVPAEPAPMPQDIPGDYDQDGDVDGQDCYDYDYEADVCMDDGTDML